MSADPYAPIRRTFLEEAFEQLDRYQSALMRFELDPRRRTELDEAMRMLHNMKGSAAGVGWGRLAAALHRVEDRLAALRKTSRVGAEELAPLFGAGDAVGRLLDLGLARGAPAREPEGAALARLEAWPEGAPPDAPRDGGEGWPGRLRRAEPVRLEAGKAAELAELAAELAAALPVGSRARTDAETLKAELEGLGEVPGERLVGRLPRVGRDLARQLGKELAMEVPSGLPRLDRRLVAALADPLVALVRNAADHGVEAPAEREAAGKARTARIAIRVELAGGRVRVEVEDDGRGLDLEGLARRTGGRLVPAGDGVDLGALVPAPGGSSREAPDLVSGRGVGLDELASELTRLGGRGRIESRPGRGTRVVLDLPARPALARMLLFARDGALGAVPRRAVLDSRRGPPPGILVGFPDGQQAWVDVERVLGELDLPGTALTPGPRPVEGMSRTTILPDGRLVPVLESWPVRKA